MDGLIIMNNPEFTPRQNLLILYYAVQVTLAKCRGEKHGDNGQGTKTNSSRDTILFSYFD